MAAPPVAEDELLLRTFNHGDPAHVLLDEGTGSWVLHGSALNFNPECSCARRTILEEDGFAPTAVIEDPRHAAIAEAAVEKVRNYEVDLPGAVGKVQPYDVEASPRTSTPPKPADRAHASLLVDEGCGLTVSGRKKAKKKLAKDCFTVVHIPSP